MTRIVIDPAELEALSVLCRNASYDAAGIAVEAQHRVDHVVQLVAAAGEGGIAAPLRAMVDNAAVVLHSVAAELDSDALALATLGQHGATADALGELAGNEHALLRRLNVLGEDTR